ncbi:replication factor C subunit 3-like [Toxorhynchites rutilus septentrionalis]|uniref:replication factor C subunit 3-like n=1 Tax=Toxorhynchites rutilus septentrionalis TaxID=329112 RepID=UPI00247AB854|nr:replication factor C subunit 3-like [Toxorhynchites rutilus septentrionalis]
MKKYVSMCRLVLCVNSTSLVITAVRSRCLGIRVPEPYEEEILKIFVICLFLECNSVYAFQHIGKKESLHVHSELAKIITAKFEYNLRRSSLMLIACKVQQYPFRVNEEMPKTMYSSEKPPIRLSSKSTETGSVQNLVENCDESEGANVELCLAGRTPEAARMQTYIPFGSVRSAVYGTV